MNDPILDQRFPRSSAYHPDWVMASVSGGANSLWLAEWLTSSMSLTPGMRVLDLGCGLAASSIFLAREFDVTVWATDLWFSANDNRQRILDAGLDNRVYPVNADARSLPFATDYFDAIIAIDSYPYFGTADNYLSYLARFVKPAGVIAIAGAGLTREIEDAPPEHLREWFSGEPGLWSLHSPAWWRRHWGRTGIVDIEIADAMPDGWQYWLRWHRAVAPDNHLEIQTIERDGGDWLCYVRVIARRRPDARLENPIESIPTQYVRKPFLRS